MSIQEYDRIRNELGNLEQATPDLMNNFGRMHEGVMRDGALTSMIKELMALAIAITVHCDGCIVYHLRAALAAGASPAQISEAIEVAVLMGGGPATIYGAKALTALDQLIAKAQPS
jgi:AhpD family alkylhydroperoxidase